MRIFVYNLSVLNEQLKYIKTILQSRTCAGFNLTITGEKNDIIGGLYCCIVVIFDIDLNAL